MRTIAIVGALVLAGCGGDSGTPDGGDWHATEQEACEHVGHCLALDFDICLAIAEVYDFPPECRDRMTSAECSDLVSDWSAGCWAPCPDPTPLVCVLNSGYKHCVEIDGSLWLVYGACACTGPGGDRYVGSCVNNACAC